MTITLTRRTLLPLVLVALCLVAAYLIGSARPSVANAATVTPRAATADPSSTGITVTGSGTVTGTPDTLSVSLSVTATASTIDDALARATRAQSAVVASLKESGVAAGDLQTSNLSISPNYTSKGLPSGYVVNEGVTAKLHGLAKAGRTLGAAVAAGGDSVRVDGIWISIDDTDPLKGDARAAAISDARNRAEQYAAAAGRKVGEVQSIREVVTTPAPYAMDARAYAMPAAASLQSVPIQAGSQDVTVQVTVVYGLA
jgi:uncharacterized protein YggE